MPDTDGGSEHPILEAGLPSDIYAIRVPALSAGSMAWTNVYVLRSAAGSLLVDTGWNTADALDALEGGLRAAGVAWGDLRMIVLTHSHPDHAGLVGAIARRTKTTLVIHAAEEAALEPRHPDYGRISAHLDDWMRKNGAPHGSENGAGINPGSVYYLSRTDTPRLLVRDGEYIRIGDFWLQVIWVPGHSAGHICLYDARRRLLFSGDHVLSGITPNVSKHAPSDSSPLADYILSLNKVRDLNVDLVLPGHGKPFSGLRERVEEISRHHAVRAGEIMAVLAEGPKTAYQVATGIHWATGATAWETLPVVHRYFMLGESIAHLDWLCGQGLVAKIEGDSETRYSTPLA